MNRHAGVAVSGVWQVCYGQPGIAGGKVLVAVAAR